MLGLICVVSFVVRLLREQRGRHAVFQENLTRERFTTRTRERR